MSFERGWIGEPQPVRDYIPGEEKKWYLMMGASEYLPGESDSGKRSDAGTP